MGWDRTCKQRVAGIRTFGLVGLWTAAAATIFSEPQEADAASRVVHGLLTGIGFFGAGVIVLRRGDTTPLGLTTARPYGSPPRSAAPPAFNQLQCNRGAVAI